MIRFDAMILISIDSFYNMFIRHLQSMWCRVDCISERKFVLTYLLLSRTHIIK